MLTALLAATLLSQGLNTSGPGVGGGKVLASFPFATPGCFASGTGGVSITRATNATYIDANGDLQTCTTGQYRVAPDGLLVEPARTNVALASNTISATNAFNVNWVAWPDETVVDVTTAAAAPVGGTWHTITNEAGGAGGSNVGQAYQTVTTASSTTFAASVWMKKPAAEDTTHAGIHVGCGAGTPSACTCVRSDGGSCTASTVATNYCQALVADLAQTAVRVTAKVTCSGAITSSIVALVPGNYGSTIGITDFTGVQHEIGAYPTSNIVTTTTAVARNADIVSATIPSVPSKWCIAATGMPGERTAWGSFAAYRIWATGGTGANSSYIDSGGMTVIDAAGASRVAGYTFPTSGSVRLIGCSTAGVLSLSATAGTVGALSGAGTGILGTPGTTLFLGNNVIGNRSISGFLKSIKVCKASKQKECP